MAKVTINKLNGKLLKFGTLHADTIVADNIPSGPIALQGAWDADTNDPDITGTTQTGYAWYVTVAGTTDLGGITDWQIGDMAVKTDTGWIKIDNTEHDAVTVTDSDEIDFTLTGQDITASLKDGSVGASRFTSEVGEMFGILDGMAFDKLDLYVVNDGGTLYFEVEKTGGGGDVRFYIDDVVSTLDCTTGAGTGGRARVALTAGADANNPQTNYLYATNSGGTATLAASTSLPTGAFAWVGKVSVPDATTWGTTGELLIQRFTEAFVNGSRGALSHAREKLRALGAVYISGGSHSLSITGGPPNTVHLEISAAEIYQLHRQTFPETLTGPYYYGNGTTQYQSETALSDMLVQQDGTAIGNNNRYNLIVWGAVNYSTGDCKVFVNMPNDVYLNDDQARADINSTADFSVPADFRSVAFLIARVVLKYTTVGGGTFTELGTYSLLGQPPGVRSGGAAAIASNEFSDSLFRIFDDGDPSREIAIEASAITTATTRTITMPDTDVNLGDIATNASAIALNTTHRTSDGKDHSDVVLNNTHRTSDGKDHSDVVLNNTHRTSNGTDHGYIDQDVTTTSTPTFAGQTLTSKQTITGSVEQGGVGEEFDVVEYVGDAAADHTLVKLLGIVPTTQDYAEVWGGEDATGQFGKGFIVRHDKANAEYEIYYSTSGKWDGTETLLFKLDSSGNQTITGTVDGRDLATDGSKLDWITVTQAVDLDTVESDTALNNTHRTSDGKNHSDVVLNNTHRTSNGSDHGYINQDVTTTGTPIFEGVRRTISTYTTTQTLDADDDLVICTTNAFTVTLPAVATAQTGKVYDIVNRHDNGTDIITVDGNSSETINGQTTQTIVAGQSLKIVNTGSEWLII